MAVHEEATRRQTLLNLSVVIPARNEEMVLADTAGSIAAVLEDAGITHEILIIDDSSADDTFRVAGQLEIENPAIRVLQNPREPGLGSAVQCGLKAARGQYVAVTMADGCDDPSDIVLFWKCAVDKDLDCVFGSRFATAGLIEGYPTTRRPFTQLGNWLTSLLTGTDYDDFTNAFKLYRTGFLTQLEPFDRMDFSFSLELALKSVLVGARYEILPNSWSGRSAGRSKFRLFQHSVSYLRTLARCIVFKRPTKPSHLG
jgi:dolichol-phosphate mannosyltransferase